MTLKELTRFELIKGNAEIVCFDKDLHNYWIRGPVKMVKQFGTYMSEDTLLDAGVPEEWIYDATVASISGSNDKGKIRIELNERGTN